MDDRTIMPSSGPDTLPTPPPAPRPISDKYLWRLIFSDAGWIITLVFGILGIVFGLVGAVLTIIVITAFIGIPFLLLGIVFLGVAAVVFWTRYQSARKILDVLRVGEAARGQILDVQENYSVSVNGRHPWVIRYQFQANGQDCQGKVTTYNVPGQPLQAGKPVSILYLPTAPNWSSIYPHP